jgi:acetoin utilization deacetylase AcuC-like enzyme
VLFCSLHIDPGEDYPYFWGHADEIGESEAAGTNRNWPLPRGTTFGTYGPALEEALAAIATWGPTALVAAAGFDTAEGDPLGQFSLTRADFSRIGAMIAAAGLPTVIIQEGGYSLDRVGDDVVAFLKAFTTAR